MATLEETLRDVSINARPVRRRDSWLSKVLKFVCSVRLGVSLLIALALACMIGMLVMQQNVDGFDRYFLELTPAQRKVYGYLGFFDVYHSWYFNALLALVSLNIILASIDRFPKTWLFASKPNVTVPVRWLRDQKSSASVMLAGDSDAIAAQVVQEMETAGWKKPLITEKNGKTFVFAQSGLWNRFGYLAVHVSLLTIFFGGFLTAQLGSTGQMKLGPGESSSRTLDTVVLLDQAKQITKQLPFEIICVDIQQKLIRADGPITVGNTIDWLTYFKIKDETGTHDAFVQMNRPFDYRGYRFFQASFTPIGRARNITVRLTPETGGPAWDVIIPRDGTVTLADGKTVHFAEFRGNFGVGRENPNENTTSYPNPGAILQITEPGQSPVTAYAFAARPGEIPMVQGPAAGYSYQLVDFEKVPDQHVLAIQRDPGTNVVYAGFAMLFVTLVGVFFFSHERVWAAIQKTPEGNNEVTIAANTNRNQDKRDGKFERFLEKLRRQESGGGDV